MKLHHTSIPSIERCWNYTTSNLCSLSNNFLWEYYALIGSTSPCRRFFGWHLISNMKHHFSMKSSELTDKLTLRKSSSDAETPPNPPINDLYSNLVSRCLSYQLVTQVTLNKKIDICDTTQAHLKTPTHQPQYTPHYAQGTTHMPNKSAWAGTIVR